MREDWNRRAREDAHYYVAFGAREQDEAAFEATAADALRMITAELARIPGADTREWRALEIGCGPGRLMKPLSARFGEIHGVDVSDEMVSIARERLRGIGNAHVHSTDGASLAAFSDAHFDFVYSYAVFQHIPSREVVFSYLREVGRVLRPGGILRAQFNSLPVSWSEDTWTGVSVSADDIHAFTRENGFVLLGLEGVGTQYLWTTWRKKPVASEQRAPALRRITDAHAAAPLVPASGRYAAASLWIADLPSDADLNEMQVDFDGVPGTPSFIGVPVAGLQQVNVWLPRNVRTGLVPVAMHAPALHGWVRIVPAGPRAPRIVSVTDGVNIVDANQTSTGLLKVHVEEIDNPVGLSATIGGIAVDGLELLCIDPVPPRYELNVRLPRSLAPGVYDLELRAGPRALLPVPVEVTSARES